MATGSFESALTNGPDLAVDQRTLGLFDLSLQLQTPTQPLAWTAGSSTILIFSNMLVLCVPSSTFLFFQRFKRKDVIFTQLTCRNVSVMHILLALSCIHANNETSANSECRVWLRWCLPSPEKIRQTETLQQKKNKNTALLRRPPEDVSFLKEMVHGEYKHACQWHPATQFLPQLK